MIQEGDVAVEGVCNGLKEHAQGCCAVRNDSTGGMKSGRWRILRDRGFHMLVVKIVRPLLAHRCEFIAGGGLQSECEQKGEANHGRRILLLLHGGYDYYST